MLLNGGAMIICYPGLTIVEPAKKERRCGYWNPQKNPAVAAFFALPPEKRAGIVRAEKIYGTEAATDLLCVYYAAGYARKKPC